MAHGRLGTTARARAGIALMLAGLFGAMFSAFAPLATAVPVSGDPSGALTGFEIEGNQVHQVAGKLDWQDLVGSSSLTVVTDDTLDTGLQGTSKENDPSGWICNTGGNNPGKANILKAAVNVRTDDTGGPWVDLALVREKGEGDTHVNFEFNQHTITNPCPFTGRTTGDLLVVADFPGGSGSANVEVYLWDSAITPDGEWVLKNSFPATKAAAASNGSDTKAPNVITDYIFGLGTIDTREFAEASLDLSAVFGENPTTCVTFGDLNVRSRSSGSSITSALQDRLPQTPVDLSTCGSIQIKKLDDADNLLDGATFGVFASEEDAATRDATLAIDTCVTGELPGSADQGLCTFTGLNPNADGYWVSELSAPDGYELDSTILGPIPVGNREDVDLTPTPFVDPRHTGTVRVTKAVTSEDEPFEVDPADLAGLRFILEQNSQQATTWPAGAPAECTLDGSSLSCDIGPVVLGDYVLTEDASTLPAGMAKGPDVPVTVDADGQVVEATITNPLSPINIALDKSGPATANVGDLITYTFKVTTTGEPLTITDLSEVDDGAGFADRCDPAHPLTGPDKSTSVDPQNDDDDLLELGETWQWTCQHTVTLADATDATDGTALWNKATVTGEDANGREVSANDTHLVTILLPSLSVDKTPDGGTVLPGQEATFTIVLSNAGPGSANDASLSDALPDGIDWSVAGTDGESCSIKPDEGTIGQVLTCDFGTIRSGDDRTVTVTGTPDTANCGVLNNTAFADAANNPDDPASDSGDITVQCADVTVLKTAKPGSINAGQAATFDITVTNKSETVDATEVVLSDNLPDGIHWTLSGADAEDCSIKPDTGTVGQVLTCSFGLISAGGTRTVTVSGPTTQRDCGVISNTASVSAGNEPADAGQDNQSTATVTVTCPPPPPPPPPGIPGINIVKDGPASATVGQSVTYTFTVTNVGAVPLSNVSVTDDKCAPVQFVGGDTNLNEQLDLTETWTYTCTRSVLSSDAPSVTNTATATGKDVQGTTVQDTDTHTLAVTAVLGAVVVPTTAPPAVQPAALPRTGSSTSLLLMLSGALLLLGGALFASAEGWTLHALRRQD